MRLLVVACSLVAPPAAAETIAGLVRVIDGDTIDVGAVRVRLHGIDAPEDDQPCDAASGAAWPCGAWVTAEVHRLFQGRRAVCERMDTDRYGRAVARCGVEGLDAIAVAKEGPGGLAGEVDMGAEIVGRGLAVAYLRYSDDYAAIEAAARARRMGLLDQLERSPAEHRARGRGSAPPHPSCAIKGNVSRNGRIFHLPGQSFYDRTTIDESRGERWFCTEKDALSAGWRPSLR